MVTILLNSSNIFNATISPYTVNTPFLSINGKENTLKRTDMQNIFLAFLNRQVLNYGKCSELSNKRQIKKQTL